MFRCTSFRVWEVGGMTRNLDDESIAALHQERRLLDETLLNETSSTQPKRGRERWPKSEADLNSCATKIPAGSL